MKTVAVIGPSLKVLGGYSESSEINKRAREIVNNTLLIDQEDIEKVVVLLEPGIGFWVSRIVDIIKVDHPNIIVEGVVIDRDSYKRWPADVSGEYLDTVGSLDKVTYVDEISDKSDGTYSHKFNQYILYLFSICTTVYALKYGGCDYSELIKTVARIRHKGLTILKNATVNGITLTKIGVR